MRYIRLGSTLFLSLTIAIGPVVQAADQGVIHLAAAIGVESTPTAPKPPATSSVPAKKPAVAAKPTATPEPPQESAGMSTSTKIWIGAGVAAGLALLAGGGGGSSAVVPHPGP